MNNEKTKFKLISEMLESSEIIRDFQVKDALKFFNSIIKGKKILFTGEGSSRIFPAKHAITRALSYGAHENFQQFGSYEARELNLKDFFVIGASNSGRTKELVLLFQDLKKCKINTLAITTKKNTPLEKEAKYTYVLDIGTEKAIAATKSVIAEAICYDLIVSSLLGFSPTKTKKIQEELANKAMQVMKTDIDPSIVKLGVNAKRIYFTGRNNGVAEELTLKSFEITRKMAHYLEGTSILHGFEEVMKKDELVVMIEPFESEEQKIKEILQDKIGIEIIAISSRKTSFPTIRIPDLKYTNSYLQLMAGWNFLVHVGLKLNLDLDKPKRARKIGNEI